MKIINTNVSTKKQAILLRPEDISLLYARVRAQMTKVDC